ncbi:hypothetical protein KCU67_g4511, partial [Aureobasidium melanogenum]
MHDKYGPIVRPNPDEIHIRDPSFFDTLYAPNPTKRNKYLPATEMVALSWSINVFAANVDSPEPLDLEKTFLAYTTDVIYDYMFDIKTNYQNNKKKAEAWRNSIVAVAQATPFCKQFPWLNAKLLALPHVLLEPVLTKFLPDIAGLLGTHALMKDIVSNYVSKKSTSSLSDLAEEKEKIKPKTLFHAIDQSQLVKDEKNFQRMYQEGLGVLFAGSETGSRLLAHTM